jgi:3',5'-cyclic AMP phosphodiesterase CpdA
MNTLKFLHLTDTHILQDYQKSEIKMLDRPHENPTDQLVNVLKYANTIQPALDFILISGDLVHEGGVEDYRYFKQLIEEHTTLPVYVALGNHDVTEAFWEGYANQVNCSENLYYEKTFLGYRMIVLDSSHDKSGAGLIDHEQLNWLEEVLKTPAQKTTFIVVHHPLAVGEVDGIHSLGNSHELMNVIKNTDVTAVLSGHTHQNKLTQFNDLLLSTAEGTSFGVELSDEMMHITTKTGFNLCTLNENGMAIQMMTIPIQQKKISSIDLKSVIPS